MNTWRVEQLGSPNVHAVVFDQEVDEGFEQYVLLSGDRHWDNSHSLLNLQKEHLELARERNAPVIDIGDLFCAMQGRGDPRQSYEALRLEHKTDDYFDALVSSAANWFSPYADLMAVMGLGNHETKVLKHHHTNLTRSLAGRLRYVSGQAWPFNSGYGGYVYFRFLIHKTVSRAIKMKIYHGSGGGGPVTKGVIQTNRRAVQYPFADIILTGHIHENWHVVLKQEVPTRTGLIKQRVQHHVCVPTYKDEWGDGSGGWHVERGAPPKPLGCVWMKFKYQHPSDIRVSFESDVI